jgi:hypothetical protein
MKAINIGLLLAIAIVSIPKLGPRITRDSSRFIGHWILYSVHIMFACGSGQSRVLLRAKW